MTLKRHDVTGELAHASVPDVKEAEGGLRDAGVLKAIEASWLVDASTPALEAARQMLLDVRDEVQDLAGRPTDRIAPEMWGPLAERARTGRRRAAQRHVRSLGRRIAHLSRLAWRRIGRRDGPRRRGSGAPDARAGADRPGHRALARRGRPRRGGARPGDDPTLLLRAAAEAASRDVVLAPTDRRPPGRGREPRCPVPWPAPARDALVRLLASGPALLPVWETLDEVEGIETFLPEWEQIRLLPHASAIHRFTVDRHVVETCAEAGTLIRSVRRPDLLLVAALLHDIGKGSLHDHSVAGEPLARKVVARMGFDRPRRRGGGLPRPLAPAARGARDHPGPRRPGDHRRAAHPRPRRGQPRAAARAHRGRRPGRLAGGLDDVAGRRWSTASSPGPATRSAPRSRPSPRPRTLPVPDVVRRDPAAVAVEIAPHEVGATVTVVAADRVGLLADVAGGLAALRVPVHAARAWSQVDADGEWGVSAWEVPDAYLDASVVRDRIRRVVEGTQRLPDLPARPDGELPPIVEVRPDASRASRSWRSVPPTAPAWSTAC